MDLVIMAAGMGSRYGGLKQIEPINENGEFIIDYSIYDAVKLGFKRVVFIIKEENFEIFKETVGKRVSKHVEVAYAFQKNDNLPKNVILPSERTKPLGTVHAMLCCKDIVNDNFVILNADDFYGKNAIEVLKNFFEESINNYEYAFPGYTMGETVIGNNPVKRAFCKVDNNNYLTEIVESSITRVDNKLIAKPLKGNTEFEIPDSIYSSMNIFAFKPSIFEYAEKKFNEFLRNSKDNLLTCEYLLSELVMDSINDSYAKIKIVATDAVWHGVTYREDKEKLMNEIAILTDKNIYPKKLWN